MKRHGIKIPYLDVMSVEASRSRADQQGPHRHLLYEPVLLPDLGPLIDATREKGDSYEPPLFYPSGARSERFKEALEIQINKYPEVPKPPVRKSPHPKVVHDANKVQPKVSQSKMSKATNELASLIKAVHENETKIVSTVVMKF